MERQDKPEKDMGSKPGWMGRDLTNEMDEYMFDLSYDEEMDEFAVLDSSNKEQKKEVKDPLDHVPFEPSDVKHPHNG
ncbi:hypothetical protein NDU88_001473 [Pleurodeles waltl]|uniref:Uncharacterized protein n=1 Tax=Pleurodeles waltl TaxID=8319 RepID=A0AAV7LCW7_PLEWA|nr:hypothetical protein NDU88_001473 [Pleurodeles waltl]